MPIPDKDGKNAIILLKKTLNQKYYQS